MEINTSAYRGRIVGFEVSPQSFNPLPLERSSVYIKVALIISVQSRKQPGMVVGESFGLWSVAVTPDSKPTAFPQHIRHSPTVWCDNTILPLT